MRTALPEWGEGARPLRPGPRSARPSAKFAPKAAERRAARKLEGWLNQASERTLHRLTGRGPRQDASASTSYSPRYRGDVMRGPLIAIAAVLSLCAVALVASLAGYLTHRETANVHVAPVATLPGGASATTNTRKVSAPPIDSVASNPSAPV